MANVPLQKLIAKDGLKAQAPALAIGFIQQNVPLKARLNLEITNPGDRAAGIDHFEYQILINNHEITSGTVDEPILIDPNGGKATVSLVINRNIYEYIANQDVLNGIVGFFESKSNKIAVAEVKIRPSFVLSNKKVSFPSFVSVKKEVSNKDLIRMSQNLY